MTNSVERYLSKANASEILQTVKSYILAHSGGGGGGGESEIIDGTYAITRNTSGEITKIVFTYSGGVETTTFTYSSNATLTKVVVKDVKSGGSTTTTTATISTNSVTISTTKS